MGISGLLPMLKEVSTPIHIKEWKGKTLAVDGYVWLHKGAYGCAEELARGLPTLKYVNYAMHRVRMLKHHGITPLLVFDGGLLPSKEHTEAERERKRSAALSRGNALLADGKASQAREHFVKAVDVSPAMAYQLIKALRREGVQYVVAPYEADPQLAYLERQGLVDGIITEDSDLLIFGCRNVLFKLDNDGQCVEVRRANLTKCREYNFAGWTDVEFRQMAILSGCDYLDSVPGMGLKTAFKLMRKYKTAEKVIQHVRLEGQLTVPPTYLDDFARAELTFCHQRVFDPVSQQLTHLHPIPDHLSAKDDLPFIGVELEAEYARGVARGEIDPITKTAVVDLVPDNPSGGPSTPSGAYYASKAKKAVPVAQGKASIMSFFAKTPTAKAAAGAAAGSPGVKPSSGKPLSAPSAGRSEAAPIEAAVKSKHFGQSRQFGQSNGKAKALDQIASAAVLGEVLDLTSDNDEPSGEDGPNLQLEVVCKEEDQEPGWADRSEAAAKAEVPRWKRELSVPSSAVHISSPPCSPPPPSRSPPRRPVRLLTDENDRSGLSQSQKFTETDCSGSSPFSSVALTPDLGCEPEMEPEEEPAQTLSSPPVSPMQDMRARPSRVAVMVQQVRMSDLSSDPIDCSSDGAHASGDDRWSARTPRQAARPVKRASDEARTAQRRRSSAAERDAMIKEEEEHAAEDVIESRQAVAADWRSKFSLNRGSGSGPTASPSTSALARARLAETGTPRAGSGQAPAAATPTPALKRSLTYNPAARVPLQPGATPPARQPFAPIVAGVNGVELAAPPRAGGVHKRKSLGVEDAAGLGGSGSSEGERDEGRDKVVVTNRRLLAFRYSGASF